MDETQRLLRLRDELAESIAALRPGQLHDTLAFEIGEIDLRLKELWSGENSGVKEVSLDALDRRDRREPVDRRGSLHRA